MNMDLLGLVPGSEMKTQAHVETQKYVERHVHIRKDSSDQKLYKTLWYERLTLLKTRFPYPLPRRFNIEVKNTSHKLRMCNLCNLCNLCICRFESETISSWPSQLQRRRRVAIRLCYISPEILHLSHLYESTSPTHIVIQFAHCCVPRVFQMDLKALRFFNIHFPQTFRRKITENLNSEWVSHSFPFLCTTCFGHHALITSFSQRGWFLNGFSKTLNSLSFLTYLTTWETENSISLVLNRWNGKRKRIPPDWETIYKRKW